MKRSMTRQAAVLSWLVLLAFGSTQAATWNNTTSGYWTNSVNWTGGAPGDGADATLPANAGVVIVDKTTSALTTFTQNGGTLRFKGWTSALQATTVNMNAGTVDHDACDTTLVVNSSNRVWIVCTNITIENGVNVNVDGLGYRGATVTVGQGPGGGTSSRTGASHGGRGGNTTVPAGPPVYGITSTPTAPGSGGAGNGSGGGGGHGGGAVRIDASERITLQGSISARGMTGSSYAAAGSGGSIWLSCRTFEGAATGLLRATGGTGGSNAGGGGGGGRIALVYDPVAQRNASLTVGVKMQCGNGGRGAENGSLYLSDDQVLPATWGNGARLYFSDTPAAISVPSLSVTSGLLEFAQPGSLTVENDVNLNTSATTFGFSCGEDFSTCISGNLSVTGALFKAGTNLNVGGAIAMKNAQFEVWSTTNVPAQVFCGGDMTLDGTTKVYTYSSSTNATYPDYGLLFDIQGDLFLGATAHNSWVYPGLVVPQNTANDAGTALFKISNLIILTNCGFNADALGYAGGPGRNLSGYGPGGGLPRQGGSHGGAGGNNSCPLYGSSNAPVQVGSGGGGNNSGGDIGGDGGGALRIQASGVVTLDGTITVDGRKAYGVYAASGSGGSIYIECNKFNGADTGLLSADGGSYPGAAGGGGGGGRIAVWSVYKDFSGNATKDGGAGTPAGTAGTLVWGQLPLPPSGTMILIR